MSTKESFNLFSELINVIKFNIIRTLHIIQFQIQSPEEEAQRLAEQLEMQRKVDEATMNLSSQEKEEEAKSIKKPARNEPCPCGSGKKYKQCCGKSGPKRGVLAQ